MAAQDVPEFFELRRTVATEPAPGGPLDEAIRTKRAVQVGTWQRRNLISNGTRERSKQLRLVTFARFSLCLCLKMGNLSD
jgi:hypothetical protein